MEDLDQTAAPLSAGSSLNELGGLNSNDNLELQKSLVKQKETDLKEMQDQIESLNQMVKQLTSQRELAIKRLADMDIKINEMTTVLETERRHVDMKDQELKSKRTQLQTLKNEEDGLKSEFERSKKDLDITTENLALTKLSNTRISGKLAELKQYLANTNSAIEEIEKSIEYKDTMRLGSFLGNPLASPQPLSVNAVLTNGKTNAPSNNSNEPTGASGALSYDPFANEDPFEGDDPFADDDPFKSEDTNTALPEDDPFNPISAAATSAPLSASSIDPFAPPKRAKDGF